MRTGYTGGVPPRGLSYSHLRSAFCFSVVVLNEEMISVIDNAGLVSISQEDPCFKVLDNISALAL